MRTNRRNNGHRTYQIRNNGETMIIETVSGNKHIAEYRFTSPGSALSEIRAMYKEIDNHLANGGTLGNYQW